MAILAFDTFNRANENPLNPADWFVISGAIAGQIVSDICCPATVGQPGARTSYIDSWPNDQYSEITLHSCLDNTCAFGCYVRMSTSTLFDGYNFQCPGPLGLLQNAPVFSWVGSSPTQIGTFTVTPNIGDVFRMSAVGTTITIYHNGVSVFSVTDTSINSGSAGIYILAGASDAVTDTSISEWEGGDFAAPDPTSISPTSGAQGATIANFTVNGTDFDANGGATISFSGTGITVNSYSVRSSTQIVASITIASNAALTARDVVVTNASDGRAGTLPAAFMVTPSGPTPPPNWSPVDSRDYGNFPNDFRVVQGSEIYDVPSVDSRAAGAPVDSRAAGAPKDCRKAPNIPENSRNPPPFGDE